MIAFTTTVVVRFRHCDPAGIVFYPRYFEMLNDLIEDWFAQRGWGFARMMEDGGVAAPLIAVEATFTAPSRLGEALRATIAVMKLGRTSCALDVVLAGADGARRVHFRPTMVCVRRDTLRPEPWPDILRAAINTPA